MRRLVLHLAFLGLGLAAASASVAQVLLEAGDAGELPATAQVSSGTGPLIGILGSLTGPANDRDMYQIRITGGGTFSATATSTFFDPQLFLFTSSGVGIYSNDDATLTCCESHLPTGWIADPGLYYLAISEYNDDPLNAGGNIFADDKADINLAFSSDPITGWTADFMSGGPYEIALTGAEFVTAVIPEPESYALLLAGLGLLGFGIRGRSPNSRKFLQ